MTDTYDSLLQGSLPPSDLSSPFPNPSPDPSRSRSPSPLPASLQKPVRKLSNATTRAISAGQSAFHTIAAAAQASLNTRSLDSQVGGHPGVLASEDNLLVIKTCLKNEREFYELLVRGEPLGGAGDDDESGGGDGKGGTGVARLAKWVPKFFGILRLEGRVREGVEGEGGIGQGTIEPVPEAEQKDKSPPLHPSFATRYIQSSSIVLENVSSLFTKPNIMDVKLGTALYEEGAPPEKKERMIEAARKTTSLETGVRLTGFQVYDYTTNTPIITPKSYGKSIKPSDLPDGARRFFPLSPSDANSTEAERQGQGLPFPLLLPILKGILADVRAIRSALASIELRMVGGSVLIVYEGDWDAARSALDRAADKELTNSAGGEGDETGYDSDLESEEEEAPAYAVRLIDFAHTRLTPGEGPDEGVLKGLDTTISLIEGRIQEVVN